VNRNGTVVWSLDCVSGNYDVESLNTGDESTNGSSAVTLGMRGAETSTVALDETSDMSLRGRVRGLVPPLLLNSLLYVTPSWWS